ncbi:MAG: quinone-dependent dihydroorotate dehydrogenase [Patescibacteria group bacterium]
MFYQKIIRPILFLLSAETAHNFTIDCLRLFNRSKILYNFLFKLLNYTSPRLKQNLFGQYFRTPLGLTAGLDKNATVPNVWSAFDFGFTEIGSVTAVAQQGNPKPRLWRLKKDSALVVNYGLSSLGAAKIAERLKTSQKYYKNRGVKVISIAKTSSVPPEQAAEDYAQSFALLAPLADIITINLSCPNVSGFLGLQKKELLEPVLKKITSINKKQKPLWLKIGQDLNKQELDDIIYLVKKYRIAAIIATNLAKDKTKLNLISAAKNNPGGISGRPISARANQIIAYLYKNSDHQYKIIGCGGIFSGKDAYDKIRAGADLLLLATGFIYGGPNSIKKMNQDLDKLISQDNFSNISQIIGINARQYELDERS